MISEMNSKYLHLIMVMVLFPYGENHHLIQICGLCAVSINLHMKDISQHLIYKYTLSTDQVIHNRTPLKMRTCTQKKRVPKQYPWGTIATNSTLF